MHSNLVLAWFLVTSAQHISCFYNLCHSRKNAFLTDDECSELFFEPSEKETKLGLVNLRLEDEVLSITPQEHAWNNAYLRVTMFNNQSNKLCNKLSQGDAAANFCIIFASTVKNDTFLMEYKAEKLPETGSRKFLMTLPQTEVFLFPYVDLTDTSHLILRAQKIPSTVNITYYQVEAFKEKNNITRLLDLRLFQNYEDIFFELFTYNDEGDYYFVLTVLSDSCEDDVCLKISTPTVYIGRKSTRLVIGIVGASFILPFVLFLFHILTKKYPLEENHLEEGILVAYKSSFKKHNDVVAALAALLERLGTNQLVEMIDLSRSTGKKFPEKFCVDAELTNTRMIYVTPPRGDSHNISVDKSFSQREILVVVFDHCSEKLPSAFENVKIFRLFEDFDGFLQALDLNPLVYDNSALYAELRRKTEEAREETDSRGSRGVPKIIVTVEEPHESDSLMASQVSL